MSRAGNCIIQSLYLTHSPFRVAAAAAVAKLGCDCMELSDTTGVERLDSSEEPELAGDWLRALDLELGRGEAGSVWGL